MDVLRAVVNILFKENFDTTFMKNFKKKIVKKLIIFFFFNKIFLKYFLNQYF